MKNESVWTAIDEQRRALVSLLEDLSDEEWAHPSLCEAWTVRDVAAHVALQNITSRDMPALMIEAVRSGGVNKAIAAQARRHAARPTEQIIAEIRDRIGVWRPLPGVSFRETAIDYVVHSQDIALPLGRRVETPLDLTVLAADRVWTSRRMFHARAWLGGYRFVATDADWSAGHGLEVTGPINGLLLLLTGRPAGLPFLSGPGREALQDRMRARSNAEG